MKSPIWANRMLLETWGKFLCDPWGDLEDRGAKSTVGANARKDHVRIRVYSIYKYNYIYLYSIREGETRNKSYMQQNYSKGNYHTQENYSSVTLNWSEFHASSFFLSPEVKKRKVCSFRISLPSLVSTSIHLCWRQKRSARCFRQQIRPG